MKKLDLAALPVVRGASYPPPYDEQCRARTRARLGVAGGLTEFGVNLLTLPPGVWSSQRHWHSHEDEFVFVVEGEVTLITEAGEEILAAGDCAAFKAGDADGHHLVNRSGHDAVVLEVGNDDPARDRCVYPDADMIARPGEDHYSRRDGTPYPKVER
ncbi:MAG: cupin domain-containing protein [Caulobacteraceae bacterium]